MLFMTETAIAEVVLRRMGAKWFIGLCVGALIVLFGITATGGPDLKDQLLANRERAWDIISLLGVLLAVMISATEIPYDISQRILLILLAKPIERNQIVVGKCIGIVTLSVVFVLICGLFTTLFLWAFGLAPDSVTGRMAVLSCLRVIAASGLALVFSASLSEVPTIILTLISVTASHVVAMFNPLIIDSSLPGFLKAALSLPLYIVPDMQAFGLLPTWIVIWIKGTIPKAMIEGASTIQELEIPGWGSVGASVLYVLAYLCAYLALAVVTFRSREAE